MIMDKKTNTYEDSIWRAIRTNHPQHRDYSKRYIHIQYVCLCLVIYTFLSLGTKYTFQ
jgi:hypothetical protein